MPEECAFAPDSICIGMPVFNGEKTIGIAIDSILSQSHQDFILVISDNASTDGTEAICRSRAAQDARIRYVRQPVNLGAEANFRYVLDCASSDYFMWAAADDVRSPDFLELNLGFLRANSDFVASTCPVRFELGEFDSERMGDRTLDDDRFGIRARRFFGSWHANGAYYSLIRTLALKRCVSVGARFLGSDWLVVLELAKQGKLNRLEQGQIVLGRKGASSSPAILKRYRRGMLDFCVPFLELTKSSSRLLKSESLPCRFAVLLACVRMNLAAVKAQMHHELIKPLTHLNRGTGH